MLPLVERPSLKGSATSINADCVMQWGLQEWGQHAQTQRQQQCPLCLPFPHAMSAYDNSSACRSSIL
jgi:hypothetical protein